MKLKTGFVLRKIADTWTVLPLGSVEINFDGMLTLNESGVFLWNLLEYDINQYELAEKLSKEYGISLDAAENDTAEFLDALCQFGCLE